MILLVYLVNCLVLSSPRTWTYLSKSPQVIVLFALLPALFALSLPGLLELSPRKVLVSYGVPGSPVGGNRSEGNEVAAPGETKGLFCDHAPISSRVSASESFWGKVP